MKELVRSTFPPVCVCEGDRVILTYNDGLGHSQVVAEHVVTETRVFDTSLVIQFDPEALDKLGLSDAIAGVFGKSA